MNNLILFFILVILAYYGVVFSFMIFGFYEGKRKEFICDLIPFNMIIDSLFSSWRETKEKN